MRVGRRANEQNRQFLLQMASDPGGGKSALAGAIGRATGAVVIDKDVLKAAALNVGAEESLASQIAYEAFFDLASSLLAMGHSVVLDSPAYFPSIRERGQRLAQQAGARYRIIECVCPDDEELARRLQGRTRLVSQLTYPLSNPYARPETAPLAEPRLTIDTSRPLEECVREALEYLGCGSRQDLRR